MTLHLIPLLAEAIKNYISEEELRDLCEIFPTEVPYRNDKPNYLQLSRNLLTTPEHGSNRDLINAIVPLILSRNEERCAHTTFERQDFHKLFGDRIQVLNQLVGEQIIPTSITVSEDHPFSAKSEAREFIGKASSTVTIVDAYIGSGSLDCLRDVQHPIRILTGSRENAIEKGFERILKDFRVEGHNIEIRTHPKLHDRYILFNERCWLVGSSLKDAGKKTFNILEIVDFRDSIQQEVEKKWSKGTIVPKP
jgi:hypothetical protein